MCPVCLVTSAAIVAASATTTGGVSALVLRLTPQRETSTAKRTSKE